MPFSFKTLDLPGLMLIEGCVFPDSRGFFMESYKRSEFRQAGITDEFVQDNHSRSSKGVLRGLHYQKPPHAQSKLVRVVRGMVWDVAVDIRRGSPTFGRWQALELSADNALILHIPSGFAHGFIALEDDTHLMYKCSAEYDKSSDRGIRWDDPQLAITWPFDAPLVSDKDAALPLLSEAEVFT